MTPEEIKMIDAIKSEAYKRGFGDGFAKAMSDKNAPGVVKRLFQ